jgi:hypothetical protein
LAAENKNEEEFKRLVKSNELIGGAGSFRDISIKKHSENIKFKRLFSEYSKLLVKMGIRNKRIKQI